MIDITIPLKAIGVNHYKGQMRNGRHFIKKEGVVWQKFFNDYILGKYKKEIELFKKDLEYPMIIEAEIYHYHKNYLTKSCDRLNKQCIDSDAPLKIIQDAYCKILGIDDKLVKQTSIAKLRGEDTIIIILRKKKDSCF